MVLRQLKNEAGDRDIEMLCLVIRFIKGKTVAIGMIDYASIFQHKNSLLYPIMSLTIYLFMRYELNYEAPLDFNNQQL